MHYQEAVDYIHSIGRFGSKPGLDRMYVLLQRMGNPERKLRYVHVAGTNGKGSTCAFIASILRAHGLSVGLYTSPYLEAFTNRIEHNGTDISPSDVARWVGQIKVICEDIENDQALGHPTQFEIITTMAFCYFAEQQVDYVVLETGLGGRLDATNVIQPDVAVITTIGLDHQHVLGHSLPEIAREKAGIIKPHCDVVSGVRAGANATDEGKALAVIREKAAEMEASFYTLEEDFGIGDIILTLKKHAFTYHGIDACWPDMIIPLLGRHQMENAAVALAACECLSYRGLELKPDLVRKGLATTHWPGRLEIVSTTPLILLDGAHNTHGTAALATAIDQLFHQYDMTLILGILDDKDYQEMIAHLVPRAKRVIITAPKYVGAVDTKRLAEEAQRHSNSVTIASSVAKAIEEAQAITKPEGLVLVAGSLYTIGEAKHYFK